MDAMSHAGRRDSEGAPLLDPVLALIRAKYEDLQAELAKTPPSREKGREWLRAVARERYPDGTEYEPFVYLADELEVETVERIAAHWRDWWKHEQRQDKRLTGNRHVLQRAAGENQASQSRS
jgi:hypothetical protein